MTAGSKLDALHAEMLGDLQEVHALLQQFRADMPSLMAQLKNESEAAAQVISASLTDFHGQSLALAEFIKQRKAEGLRDIEQATVMNARTMRRGLATFANSLWALGGISALNLILLIALVLQGQK